MNILFLTYQGGIAGSTYSIQYLSRGLSSKGHTVVVGCRKESLLYSMLENSDIIRIPMTFKGKYDLETMRIIRDTVTKYDIHIINAQSSNDRYISIFARWLYRLPVKVIHTRRQMSKSSGGIVQGLFYTLGTDAIIAVSNGVKKSLCKTGIPDKHITVIHNGTPREKYAEIPETIIENLRNRYNINKNDFVIGCVSRRKKQDQLLKALTHVDFTATVLFIGINKEPCDEQYLKQLSSSHTIHFLGSIDPHNVLPFYKLFSVCVLASTMEGLSQALLEAMAFNVPVIATNAAGNTDLIKDSENGYLFEDGNIHELAQKIKKVHYNRTKYFFSKIIENAHHTALDSFSIEKTVDTYESFFSRRVYNSSSGFRQRKRVLPKRFLIKNNPSETCLK